LAPQGRLRWSVVRRTVAGLAPRDILELGCGLGAVGARLARMAHYTGVEPDDTCAAVAAARIGPVGGEVVHGDHSRIPPERSFDLVCAFEVLEHIESDQDALSAWVRLVRPGGHILLSVPADPDRFAAADVLVGHYRRYTAEDLGTRLRTAGATDISVRHYGWPLGYLLEGVRNRMARPRLGTASQVAHERTATSGRTFQPRAQLIGGAIRLGVAPFSWLQELRPSAGPGLIAVARRG
jgi:SAM-dependent methyltransferase